MTGEEHARASKPRIELLRVMTEEKKRLSLTSWIVLSLVGGVLTGLFLGEYCLGLQWVGSVFIGLLQMAVLPYVALSLICNVGRLSAAESTRLAKVGVLCLLVLWGIGLLLLLVMSLSFPPSQSGSFFSTSFVEEPEPTNWLDLFIPSNPFSSLANNMVPAVVVFSIGLGIALMGVPNKATLLEHLAISTEALARLNRMMIKLSPVGIFALAASAAGTMTLDQFALVQGYLLSYGAAAGLLMFVLLPLTVASLTPYSYRDVMSASKDALIAALVIGNTFVVLPLIIEGTRKLLANRRLAEDSAAVHSPEFVVPMAYAFPDVGRIVGLIFIPFAAWFYGISLDPQAVPALVGTGFLGSFGKLIVTIPLLLDLARIPLDIFDLFLSVGVVAARFGDGMKTMHLFVFAVLATCGMTRTLRVNWPRLGRNAVICGVASAVTVGALNAYLRTFHDPEETGHTLTDRALIDQVGRTEVRSDVVALGPNPQPLKPGQTCIERIRERGVLRVGIVIDEFPFCFFNNQGDLVGLDIEMAFHLARDIGVDVEFVPIGLTEPAALDEQFQDDCFDIVMSGVEATLHRFQQHFVSDSYMDVTLAIVVEDHRKDEFKTAADLRKQDVRFAVLAGSFFQERGATALPDAELIPLANESEFFNEKFRELDGLITSAETGSAWTLLRPSFTVVNPLSQPVRVPLVYPTATDGKWLRFVNGWLELRRKDGTVERLYDHWVLGEDAVSRPPRWCILRDVLGWVD